MATITSKKMTVDEVVSTMPADDYVISTVTRDDGTTVDVAFRYPRYRDFAVYISQSKTADEVTAQVTLLRMTCLTHDHKELDALLDQRSGLALILKTTAALSTNLSVGVEVKKSV